jgi:CubicO group peptidase (beta-lactamase class C family)
VFHSYWLTADGRRGASGEPSVILPWWSFTKTVIAVCAWKLVEAGIVDLDAPLPAEPYTLRQLLQHRAGVPNYGGLAAYHAAVARGDAPWSRRRLLRTVRADELLFEPGAGWAYSNVGYMFARERIEALSGRDFADLVVEYVCAPLGLASVRFARTRADFAEIPWSAAARYDPGWVYHGCLVGTAKDAAVLLHGLFDGSLLRRDSVEAMTAARPVAAPVPDRPWSRTGYAAGLMSGEMTGAGGAIGHSGGGPFSVVAVYHFPDAAVSTTAACFTEGTDEGVAEFEAARLAARTRPAPQRNGRNATAPPRARRSARRPSRWSTPR